MNRKAVERKGGQFVDKQLKPRVVVVDDHAIVRKGLVRLLDEELHLTICADVSTVAEALLAVARHTPDLLLVDISLEGASGMDLVKKVKVLHPKILILVLSMHEETLFAERVIKAGAHGYIMKQAGIEQLQKAIARVLQGNIYVSSVMEQRLLIKLQAPEYLAQAASPVEILSDREIEVYEMIGSGHTTRQISQKLNLSIKTIETYRANIKGKLGLSNGLDLIRSAMDWTHGRARQQVPMAD